MLPQVQYDFSEALRFVKNGGRVARAGWTRVGMYLFLTRPTYDKAAHLTMFVPGRDGKKEEIYPHLPNQVDVLAEDWVVV